MLSAYLDGEDVAMVTGSDGGDRFMCEGIPQDHLYIVGPTCE